MIHDEYTNRKDLSAGLKHYYRNHERQLEIKRTFKQRYPAEYILNRTRSRAKDRGIEFDLECDDIVIPETCPILKIPLIFSEEGRNDNTPSIDRVNNTLGYIKGNIRIISWRANWLKRNLIVEEVRSILKYMEDNEIPSPN